jgi:hypothetical protein
VTCAAASRATLATTATFGTATAMNADGACPLNAEGRYHRFRTTIAAGASWEHAQGVTVEAVDSGRR